MGAIAFVSSAIARVRNYCLQGAPVVYLRTASDEKDNSDEISLPPMDLAEAVRRVHGQEKTDREDNLA